MGYRKLATRQRKKSRLREPRFLMAAICILALVLPDPADVPTRRMFYPTLRMFDSASLVWICNPDPLSIRIFNPPGSNELNRDK